MLNHHYLLSTSFVIDSSLFVSLLSMPPKKSDKNGIRTKKGLKRGGSRNAELEEEEPGVYPPIPWYAGEERNYSRYTWKSKL